MIGMIGIICCIATVIAAGYIVCTKYLKTDKNPKFYVLSAVSGVLVAACGVVMQIKQPNMIYNYLCVVFLGVLSCLAIEDMQGKQVDKILSLVLAVLGMVTAFFVPDYQFWKVILFTVVLTFILYILSIKSGDAVGKGDVICIGAATLCFNFANVFSLMIGTLMMCLIYGIIQIAMKKIDRKQGIAFVPFLMWGMVLTLITSI